MLSAGFGKVSKYDESERHNEKNDLGKGFGSYELRAGKKDKLS